ncbi:DNA topoisomerase IV subunit A [Spiroplasma turonicum]|uniref:DNA topoisomerase 4 subunit A n=1 Tax=Spiroplasma turonicum TaxID=216946 RepID=A0A0K1P5P9_9MOLU|nr:DNA topoisomerase IV subunit A [Spiroplasma turonicum]AKU79633.1 DNA topoisomerase IV subunit A [Spiroplasma turonicum]ALX70654.1 DNA topoisomerase IV subunit A [Spiroplasma turonicum]
MSDNNKNGIINYSLEDLMSERFGRYAKYIIQERALPDVRDGLKPVQRRILFTMNEINLTHDKAYKKSARIVGDVIGKYHPHGDTSVYEALVRMSQDWKLNMPLVDMQGNNGSIDGDGAAAMRYTESRLSKITSVLLEDLQKNTVLFAPNYDDSEKEPTVLPGYFPNILINGSTGIAAGYATNMPPHNLGEIIDATIHLVKKPKSTFNELSKIVKGPDFPTGGIAMGREGIESAFLTGKGRVIIQSRITREDDKIVIDQIPYEVVKQDLVRKIGEVVELNPQLDVKEVRDETDRDGLRIVVELNPDADYELIRKFLLKNTALQVSYNYNNVVIVDKQPKQLGLIDIIKAYIKHYKDVFLKKTKFDLDKSEKRLEIIEGLVKAISILDEVIQIIRNSSNRSDAILNLINKYQFTENQAVAIVDLRLYRLTSTDIVKLNEEKDLLNSLISKLKSIINDEGVLNNEIISKLSDFKKEFSIPRRTKIVDEVENIDVELKKTIVEKDYTIWVSQDGYLKAIEDSQLGKFPIADFKRKPNDIWVAQFPASSLDFILLVSSAGTYFSIPVYKINPSKWKEIGMHLNEVATIAGHEKILAAFVVKKFENAKQEILLASKKGMIKRTPIEDLETKMFSKAFRIMKLQDGDELVSASLVTSKTRFVTMVTNNGYSVRYDISEIPSAGQNAKGVKSTVVKDDDIIAGKAFDEKGDILILTNKGNVKKIKQELVPLMNRPKRGVRLYPWNKKRDEFATFLYNVQDKDILNILDDEDNLTQLNIKSFKYADLEDVPEDLDMTSIITTTLEKSFVVKNGDIPIPPKSNDDDSNNNNDNNNNTGKKNTDLKDNKKVIKPKSDNKIIFNEDKNNNENIKLKDENKSEDMVTEELKIDIDDLL